jgi:hypothetical protein
MLMPNKGDVERMRHSKSQESRVKGSQRYPRGFPDRSNWRSRLKAQESRVKGLWTLDF